MSGHTRGPWVQFADQGKCIAIMPAMREGDVCTFNQSPSDADARLIAAAPDMAAALGKCITALMFEAERHAREQDGVALAQVHDAIMSARAALTKAKEQT
jgi:hypothetical protein